MQSYSEQATERTQLLSRDANERRASHIQYNEALASHLSKEELGLGGTPIGERLPYNDYATIDWLRDLVKDCIRYRRVHSRPGVRYAVLSAFDSSQGWLAVALIGILTATVAFLIDISVATVSDWKLGYCSGSIFTNHETCCAESTLGTVSAGVYGSCEQWKPWTSGWQAYGLYVVIAVLFGVLSSSLTMLTKHTLPTVGDSTQNSQLGGDADPPPKKIMYMAAGSGIPEIKTILSGFVIKGFLGFKVLAVKAIGAVFAVSAGWLVGRQFPKYNENGRKMRELLSAACSSGLSVAFGAPIGGVLFSYEEISTYFPRKVLWRAFLCSLLAAVALKILNPTRTGKLVLFETNYGTTYDPIHYLVFILLGIAGGIFGGVFCKANFLWSKKFRKFALIKSHPVFEVFLVTLVTAILQYPNPLIRHPGDVTIKELLVDCRLPSSSWVCRMETSSGRDKRTYIGWLVYGIVVKLVLTTITFGCKVPSGIIIPALDGGALFGRLIGQWISSISPGIFAMVGAAAFLAGVSRMTISLCVIMFELTGELEYIVPHMIAILVAKWVADALEKEGVYDLAQTVLGHPFLDLETSLSIVRAESEELVEVLIPPPQTMQEITVDVDANGCVERRILDEKLQLLKRRGLLDAGVALVQSGLLQGYLAEDELEFGLNELGQVFPDPNVEVRLLPATPSAAPSSTDLSDASTIVGSDEEAGFDISMFIDRTPLTISVKAPLEYAIEVFGKLGLRYLCVVEEGTSKLVGVIIKKRVVAYLDGVKHGLHK